MEKILVLGASGMAGHVITLSLKEKGYDVTGFARSGLPFCRVITGDAADLDGLKRIVTEGGYDYIVNAIGILRESEKRKAEAVYINSYLPHLLADMTQQTDTRVIHISTDCVFRGNTGPYTEDSLRDGQTFYDRSKALGELEDDRNLTLRTSIVGPDMRKDGVGLFNWFMMQQGEVTGYERTMWTGVTSCELADIIDAAIRENVAGLYNMVGDTNISKYGLLQLFNRYMCGGVRVIRKDESRQVDKSLVRTKFDFSYRVRDYETMVRRMADWIEEHKELYPHYKTDCK